MKVQSVSCFVKAIPLNQTFITAVRETNHIYDLYIELTCDSGLTALGSAPAATLVTGDSLESMQFVIENFYSERLIGLDCEEIPGYITKISDIVPFNFGAKMAVDMACYNLMGKLVGVSLVDKLGGSQNKKLATSITLSCGGVEEVCKRAQKAINKGFTKLKIKLGTEVGHDIKIMQAIHERFGHKNVEFMVDANQGWREPDAFKFIDAMQKVSIKLAFLEQPVNAKSIQSMRAITQSSPWPIVADESIFSKEDARYYFEQKACDIVNIKLAKCGGIHQAIEIKKLADQYNKKCMVGCMMESPLGVLAAASFALAYNIKLVDLDPIDWVDSKEYEGLLSYSPPFIII